MVATTQIEMPPRTKVTDRLSSAHDTNPLEPIRKPGTNPSTELSVVPLHTAILKGDVKKVCRLLTDGASPLEKNTVGLTALDFIDMHTSDNHVKCKQLVMIQMGIDMQLCYGYNNREDFEWVTDEDELGPYFYEHCLHP